MEICHSIGDYLMRSYRIIILMVALLTLLTLATGGFAQRVNPDDRDGDGLPNIADRCPDVAGPRENGGCPLATATPISGPVADRDGDGVQDFVDRCPDQPGTGFTEGCPTDQGGEQPAGTPPPERAQPVFVWWVDDRCLVANRGSENVNVRDGVPDDRSRANVIDALRPGEQFAPLYVVFDASNTPWYGALGFGAGRLQGLGWVSGAVTVAHGDCANLGAPPTTPPRADEPVCVVIVTAEAGATVFSEALPDAAQVETLPHGAYLPAANVHTDSRGDLWYQVAPGWLRGIDVTTAGNCTFNNLTFTRLFSPIDQITVEEISLEDIFGKCMLTTLPGQTLSLYWVMQHHDPATATVLPAGSVIEATGVGVDLDGHMWYAAYSVWADSAEVMASGACTNLTLPPASEYDACQLWLTTAVDLLKNPAPDAEVIGSVGPGAGVNVTAATHDANQNVWYYVTAYHGWVNGSNQPFINPGACTDLPEAPPQEPLGECVITTIGDGAGLWAAPSHDGAGLYAGGNPGAVYTAVGIDYDANGHLWYNVDGAWIDSDEVVTSGNCADLPIYKPTNYSQCQALIPYNGPGVYLFKDYLSNPLEVVALAPGPGRVDAAFAATDPQGTRWYHVRYEGAAGVFYGWVNSGDVIEMVPSLCDDLPPMTILPPDLIDIDLQPIVWKP
ncbi:MAG: thrombospondin type 3 repeat-containing protein [Chloroflexi bacterium]|nr:thrombospondin type 3 repeat-containing protein [Chloroflexota bacterium]